MEKVHLYTMQHRNSLSDLRKHGRFINQEKYIQKSLDATSPFIIPKYRIFSGMAKEYVPRPQDVLYPVWCGVSQETCFKVNPGCVIYCLRVPVDQVIYFDGSKWDFVLNGLYIPKDEVDAQAHEQELQDLGIDHPFGLIDRYGGQYPELVQKIRSSWTRLFEIDDWNEYAIQANLWEIKEEWVQHIVYEGDDLFEVAKDMEKTFPPSFAKSN